MPDLHLHTFGKGLINMQGVSIKTRVILEKEGQILLIRQTRNNGGAYTLVGGKVEEGETVRETLIRECWEEAGLRIREHDLELVHVLHKISKTKSRLTLFFKAKKWTGNLKAKERHKFKELEWIALRRLPEKLKPTIRAVLLDYIDGKSYSELKV